MTDRSPNPDSDFSLIIEAARLHYENLKTDISKAKDRVEHIRLTALANEALSLWRDLEIFELGMMYTRIQSLGPIELERYMQLVKTTAREKSEILNDIPEFKSPFDPKNIFKQEEI